MDGKRIVSVIAGGWSLRELGDPGRARIPGFKIGVNDSMLFTPCDTGVTMDRLWIEHRLERAQKSVRNLWARRSAMVNVKENLSFVRKFDCDHETAELSDKAGWLNGRNSGHCALNLAYKMRPRSIVLWGFDMNRSPSGETHWYELYGWSKPGGTPDAIRSGWAADILVAAEFCRRAGVRLLNASPSSAIISIEKIDPWSLLQ